MPRKSPDFARCSNIPITVTRMSALDLLFSELRSRHRKALMPFITAGDPDLKFTADVLRKLVQSGAHLCELGIPYSDPIADGPTIQDSYTRALAQGIRLQDIFAMCGQLTPQLDAPLVTMVSFAIIYRHGIQRYLEEAVQAGLAGLIVPDLPVDESAKLAATCLAADVSLIQLVTPTTSRERSIRIAETSSGFIYYVSVTGITGERTKLPPEIVENVAWLRQRTPLPICIGFGISEPQQVKLLSSVADGLIVGSAIVRRMAQATSDDRTAVLNEIGDYVGTLISALDE